MQTNQNQPRLSKVKLTYLVLALAALCVASTYGYQLFTLYRAAQRDQPHLQAQRLIRDLRRYERLQQRFPANFHELNQQLWQTQPAPDDGKEGRQARTKNYYYVYQRIEDGKCVFWALPIGPRRERGAAYFFVIAPTWLKVWRGRALPDEQLGTLPLVPTPAELAHLSLWEVTPSARRSW